MENNTKKELHPKNAHNKGYNLSLLAEAEPQLKNYFITTKKDTLSLNFSEPEAVLLLNKALLKTEYNIKHWSIPKGFLCPPIPSRVDYIHYLNDLIEGNIKQEKAKILDIGTGANCIYPLLGNAVYNYDFVGSEIDQQAYESAAQNCSDNKLTEAIKIRFQKNKRLLFKDIIRENEYFNATICNPPFHLSKAEAEKANSRKNKNLSKSKDAKNNLNFGGVNSELWYEGGEIIFLTNMIYESVHFAEQVGWFTSLISKSDNLRPLIKILDKVNVAEHKIIEMSTPNKKANIICWRF